MVQTVCVVGCGVSGLTAVKACLEQGLQVKAYEQDDQIGGIWYYTEKTRINQGAASYQRLVSNDPRETLCFSDHPFDDHSSQYVTHEAALQYLKGYATHFGLWGHIQLGTRIVRISKSENFQGAGKWEVISRKTDTETEKREIFDAVMIASGCGRKSFKPDIHGLDQFPGKVTLCQEFRKGETFENDTVLVIGNGISAGDLTSEVSHFAKKIYLSVGHGTWVYPTHLPDNVPMDFTFTRKAAYWDSPQTVINELSDLVNSNIDHVQTGLASDKSPMLGGIMVTSSLRMPISCGRVIVKGWATSIEGRTVHFDDGSTSGPIDHILIAAGYVNEYPFLEEAVIKGDTKSFIKGLYKMVFPQDVEHNTLAFIGSSYLPGPMWSTYELQARWAAGVFSGKYKLPPSSVMQAEMKQDAARSYNAPPNFLTVYRDNLADLVGCKPKLLQYFFTDPRLAIMLWTGPPFSSQYRIEGPNSCPDARERFLGGIKKTVTATKQRKVQQFSLQSSWIKFSIRHLFQAGIIIAIVAAVNKFIYSEH